MARQQPSVGDVVAALDPDRRAQVQVLRAIVREAGPDLVEVVKWNAPSWVHDGEDRLTVNTMNKERLVKLVLHMGTARPEVKKAPPVMDDPAGLVAWSSDIRGIVTFQDLADLEAKQGAVVDLIGRWLAIPV